MTSVSSTELMNRTYRYQRHIYDFTRKYFLLGRDRLIDDLAPRDGDAVLEIGCGTGRNLAVAAARYPAARLFGIDVSTEMLASASATIARAGLAPRVRLAHADATSFDPQPLFGIARFDRVFVSYSLSMIPQWEAVIDHALVDPRSRRRIAHRRLRRPAPAARPCSARCCAAGSRCSTSPPATTSKRRCGPAPMRTMQA